MTTDSVGNNNEPVVVKTDVGAKDGQQKCPKCGATEISLNPHTGMLRCKYCRHEFENEKVEGMQTEIHELEGEIIGSGTQDIQEDAQNILTLKCTSCGAEVVIDTSEKTIARCHWCRNTLTVNQQIPNGSIPDVVLPFKLTKDEAKRLIEDFVGKRKFFANPKFKEEFTVKNIMGVYFPYMLVDLNGHAALSGQGEKQVRRYTKKVGENTKTYYDADLYDVKREFDIAIEGLTVEASSDKLNKVSSDKTNNVINAIMPFDIENSVKWNSNFLKGYTSEKRDTNIDELRPLVEMQAKDIARHAANETLTMYDRGVHWSNEQLELKGKQWKSAYLPVWLYSYQEVKGNKKILHYVAVNARTKEVMGSVPIHVPKLLGVSVLVEILAALGVYVIEWEYDWLLLSAGVVYYLLMYNKYRNRSARHKHEAETKRKMRNIFKVDNFVRRRTGLTNSSMEGANNTRVSGPNVTDLFLNALKKDE